MELSIAILMKLQIDWILKSETQFPSLGTVAALRAQRTGYPPAPRSGATGVLNLVSDL
jgi:hypothetical protein